MTPIQLLGRGQWVFFFLFTVDIFFAGSGASYFGYDLALRKIFFGIFALLSIVVYFSQDDADRPINSSLMLALLIVIFVWVIAIPATALQGSVRYAISDSTPVLAAGIALLSLSFPIQNGNWQKLRNFSHASLIAFSILHIALFLLFYISPDTGESARTVLMSLWEPPGAEESLYVFLVPLSETTHRIYFGSSFLLLLGLYFSVQNRQRILTSSNIAHGLLFILFFGALWTTNTRSLLLGAVAFVPLAVVMVKVLPRLPFNVLTLTALLLLPFLASFIFSPVLDPDFLAAIGLSREGSDDLRSEQFRPLLSAFLRTPMFGSGFGSGIELVRSEAAPYAYELAVLTILMKVGVVGVIAGCLLLAHAFELRASRGQRNVPQRLGPLYALYFSFILSCFFNPYLFGFFGTFFLLFILYEYSFLMAEKADD